MNYACDLERFRKDTATHEMEVLLDHGVYRHLRFRRPGTSAYGFDIVTWPGHLAISGDMGGSVFARLADMFEFFRASEKWHFENPGKLPINVGYWSEKLVANDGDAKRYSRELFEAALKQRFDEHFEDAELSGSDALVRDHLWARIESEACADSVDQAIDWAERFEPEGVSLMDLPELHASLRFRDFWDLNLREYDFHLVWRLYAVAHAIRAYDQAKRKVERSAAPYTLSVEAAKAAYLELLQKPPTSRWRIRNQAVLAGLRDYIASGTGRASQHVQEEFEEMALLATRRDAPA